MKSFHVLESIHVIYRNNISYRMYKSCQKERVNVKYTKRERNTHTYTHKNKGKRERERDELIQAYLRAAAAR